MTWTILGNRSTTVRTVVLPSEVVNLWQNPMIYLTRGTGRGCRRPGGGWQETLFRAQAGQAATQNVVLRSGCIQRFSSNQDPGSWFGLGSDPSNQWRHSSRSNPFPVTHVIIPLGLRKSFRERNSQWWTSLSSMDRWERTAPMTTSEASTATINCLQESGRVRKGAEKKLCLSLWNARSAGKRRAKICQKQGKSIYISSPTALARIKTSSGRWSCGEQINGTVIRLMGRQGDGTSLAEHLEV